MRTIRRYEVDGLIIDIPLQYDSLTKMYIEDYPNFKDEPIYTPNGHQLTVAVMDVCKFAQPNTDGACTDCSDCVFFRRAAEKTLFGVCMCEHRRCVPDGNAPRLDEEVGV